MNTYKKLRRLELLHLSEHCRTTTDSTTCIGHNFLILGLNRTTAELQNILSPQEFPKHGNIVVQTRVESSSFLSEKQNGKMRRFLRSGICIWIAPPPSPPNSHLYLYFSSANYYKVEPCSMCCVVARGAVPSVPGAAVPGN